MNVLLQVNPIYAKEFWHQVHRKRQMDQKAGLGDFSEGNIVYKMLLHDGYFDRIRDELGEKISKTAWDENFSLEDYDLYTPPVGSIWTMSDPWALTKNPPGPDHRTIQVEDIQGFGTRGFVWYRDLDTQSGKDERDGMSIKMWNDKMHREIIRQKNPDWTFQETPDEAAEHWPDTLPSNWSMVRVTQESVPIGPGWIREGDDIICPRCDEWVAVIPASSFMQGGIDEADLPEQCPRCGWPYVTGPKIADDLSWVDKSTPYGTPAGGVVTGPEHGGDDSIDLPSEPGRDITPPDNENVSDPKGSLKVIYDFERDQIILGDVRKAEQFPPGQIIGDYRDGDVYLNSHAEAWFNANYFKRLWQHSFPKRPIRHVILDKGHGQHEIVHREPTSAILGTYEQEDHQDDSSAQGAASQDGREAQERLPQAQGYVALASGEYRWPDWDDIDTISQAAVENHQGYRDIGLIQGAVGNTQMQHQYGAHADIFDTAANLIAKIQRQQAIVEGNKRTATAVGMQFLEDNGYDTSACSVDEATEDRLIWLVYNISDAGGDAVIEQLAEFLREHCRPIEANA